MGVGSIPSLFTYVKHHGCMASAEKMFARGLSFEDVAEFTGLPVELLLKLQSDLALNPVQAA